MDRPGESTGRKGLWNRSREKPNPTGPSKTFAQALRPDFRLRRLQALPAGAPGSKKPATRDEVASGSAATAR
ncbi:hypothetical protein ACSSVZ_000340 [Amorphus sp. MBR-141]